MDVPYTAFTFISIVALMRVQNARGAVGDEWPKRSFAARGSGSMDADRNPASGMNCLQQNQFENLSLFGSSSQCDKTLNKVFNVGRGFIPTRASKLAEKTISQDDATFWAKAQPTHTGQQAQRRRWLTLTLVLNHSRKASPYFQYLTSV